jgi:hypothetical protein
MVISDQVFLNLIYLGLQYNRWWANNNWGGLKPNSKTNIKSDNTVYLKNIHKYGSTWGSWKNYAIYDIGKFLLSWGIKRYQEGEFKKNK